MIQYDFEIPSFAAAEVARSKSPRRDRYDLRALASLHRWDNLSDRDLRSAKNSPSNFLAFIVFPKSV